MRREPKLAAACGMAATQVAEPQTTKSAWPDRRRRRLLAQVAAEGRYQEALRRICELEQLLADCRAEVSRLGTVHQEAAVQAVALQPGAGAGDSLGREVSGRLEIIAPMLVEGLAAAGERTPPQHAKGGDHPGTSGELGVRRRIAAAHSFTVSAATIAAAGPRLLNRLQLGAGRRCRRSAGRQRRGVGVPRGSRSRSAIAGVGPGVDELGSVGFGAMRNRAAARLQAAVRGHLVRMRERRRKAEGSAVAAACRLQAFWRERQAMARAAAGALAGVGQHVWRWTRVGDSVAEALLFCSATGRGSDELRAHCRGRSAGCPISGPRWFRSTTADAGGPCAGRGRSAPPCGGLGAAAAPPSPLPSPRSVVVPATAVAGTAAAKRRRKKDRKGKGAGLATLAASSVAAQTDVQRQAEGLRLADTLGQRDGVADFADFDEAERQLADVRALLLAGELSRASRSQLQGAETVLLVRLAHALERGWRPRAPSARG